VPAGTLLVELVTAAGLTLPLRLHARYRDQVAEAVMRPDGWIVCGGERYRSPSTAGTAARLALGYDGTRKRPATNGWTWWWYTDSDGVDRRLDHLRTSQADAESSR